MRKWLKIYTFVGFVMIVGIFLILREYVAIVSVNTVESVANRYVDDLGTSLISSFDNVMELRMGQVRSFVDMVPRNSANYDVSLKYCARAAGFEYLAYYTDEGCEMLYGEQMTASDYVQLDSALKSGNEKLVVGTTESGNDVLMFAIPASFDNSYGLVAALPISYLDKVLYGEGSRVWTYAVMRRDGTEVYHQTLAMDSDVLHTLLNEGSYSSSMLVDGRRYHVQYIGLDYAGWFLGIIVDYSYFDDISESMTHRQSLLFTLVSVLSLLIVGSIFALYLWELYKQKRESDSASMAKSEFIANLSHDVRTPMNAVVGNASILASSNVGDEEIRTCVDKILSSSKYVMGLLNNLLDISSIGTEDIVVNNSDFMLGESVHAVLDIIKASAEEKHQKFSISVEALESEYLFGDSVRFMQVMMNILDNAVKFTPEGGVIEFVMWQKGEELSFQVSDTGIGISKEFLSKVYIPFSREDAARTGSVNGVGIGLSIVKSVLDAVGGTITITTTKNNGCTVFVTYPLKQLYKVFNNGYHIVRVEGSVSWNMLFQAGLEAWEGDTPYSVAIAIDNPDYTDNVPVLHLSSPVFASDIDKAFNIAKSTVLVEEIDISDKNILIAEDNEMNYEILEALLEDEVASVSWAKDGSEAVRMFRNSGVGEYYCILMDLRMPEMDGFEATRVIRKMYRNDAQTIPIIAVTADGYAEAEKKAMDAGMSAFITKPVDIDELLVLLKKGGK